MPDKVELSTFPASRFQALAMLWLKNQDLSNKTPAEISNMYDMAYNEIRKAKKEIKSFDLS